MLVYILLTIIVLSAMGWLAWYVVAAPGSQVLGPSLAHGRADSGAVALTFDDGPGEATPRILDLLRQVDVKATFFLCGANVEKYPELAHRIAEEGHEIGNHTYSHPRLLGRTPGKIAWEIERAQRVIAPHTGCAPELFRPPYGLRWFGLFPILQRNSMQLVMWSVNGRDWQRTPQQIAESVLREAQNGSIILLHDGMPPGEQGSRAATAEALENILPELQKRFRLVTVSKLCGNTAQMN